MKFVTYALLGAVIGVVATILLLASSRPTYQYYYQRDLSNRQAASAMQRGCEPWATYYMRCPSSVTP
jgi:hypothetical protein